MPNETAAGPEQKRLRERLQAMGTANFNVFPGTNPNATPEQVAGAVNRALDQLEAGEFEDITDVED